MLDQNRLIQNRLELKRAWLAEWLAGCTSMKLVWLPSGKLAGLINNRLVWIV